MTAPASYVSARHLAKRYGVSPRQIAYLAESKRMPGFKVGSQWRFDEAEVHEVLTRNTTNPFPKAKP